MSGPKSVEYVIVDALLEAAWGAYQSDRQRRYEEASQQQAEAERREQARRAAALRREEERRAREEAQRRAERAAELLITARGHEQRLARATRLAAEARARYPEIALDLPMPPAAPSDTGDPAAIERYIALLEEAAQLIEARIREQSIRAATTQGASELMNALAATVGAEPRSAAELLTMYANEVQALRRPAATRVLDRKALAERILGRLTTLEPGAIPAALGQLMRDIMEAASDDRAELLALELRAQVQQLNDETARAAAAAQENRTREMTGLVVAEVLADLGYEVEPITETLFVQGGIAHFQRAEWGDYYVRMRVDPATRNINVNMVRATTDSGPPDPAQRRRDQDMEAAWCAGLPKLLAELAARGVDTRKLRELDAGALPVQAVKPETIDPILRTAEEKRAAAAPRELARPIK